MPADYYLELFRATVRPADRPWEEGIEVRDGRTLPFLVERSWSGPAGTYLEEWSIRRGEGEIVFRSPTSYAVVRGMQSVSSYTSRVDEPVALEPGTYQLVFVVEGYLMGSVEIEVRPARSRAA